MEQSTLKRTTLTLKKSEPSSKKTSSDTLLSESKTKPSMSPQASSQALSKIKHVQKTRTGKASKEDQTTLSSPPQKKTSPYAVYRSTLKTVVWLEETYPHLFNTNHPKPLAKGVTKHLLTQGPFPHSNKRIRQGVWLYTNFKGYHEAIVTHTHRYTLEGEVSEPITDDEKAHSQEILTQRQQKTRRP